MDIDIQLGQITVPVKITMNGKSYPIHPWNIDIVNEYRKTKDESVLKKLKDFSLAI